MAILSPELFLIVKCQRMKAYHNFPQPAKDLTRNSNVTRGIISLTDLDFRQ